MAYYGYISAFLRTTVASTLLNGLRARWSLDEASGTRNDSVGTSHLTDNNTVPQTTGKLSNAASFNGTNEYLSVADNAALSFANGTSFTLACWLNPTSLVSGATPINKGDLIFNATNFEYALEFLTQSGNTNLLWIISNNTSSSALNCSAGVLATSTWHLVIAWYDHAGPLMYIQLNNGTPVSQAAPSGGTSDQAHAFHVGSSGAGGAFFPGAIDEVVLWDRALTTGERDMLWNSGNGKAWPY